jgi:hypothetical protein
MKSFLEKVANDIVKKYGTDLSRIAVVFPNKRAALFMNDYLMKSIGGTKPIWSPVYITITDLFLSKSKMKIGDPIKLVCDLYKVYKQVSKSDETLDHFYGWGQMMISDFDDLDKNLADADKLFRNVKDIHEMDTISYLTDYQKENLHKFFLNFNGDDTELKRRFMELWNNLCDIYHEYNELLLSEGITYEGALYRSVVNDSDVKFEYDTYLFVGFNVLQKVEQKLFSSLQHDGKGKFYWDYDKYYMQDVHEAGIYIRKYMSSYPNELDNKDGDIYDTMKLLKDISFISAATENIQARYVSKWLNDEIGTVDRNSVIVMCNEGILPAILHSLPPKVEKVNITTGYPLLQSPVSTLISLLLDLQTNGFTLSGSLRRQYALPILNHPYAKYISAKSYEQYAKFNTSKRFIINGNDIVDDSTLKMVFEKTDDKSPDYLLHLVDYLLSVLKCIAQNAGDETPLFTESLYRAYTLIVRLQTLVASGDLDVDISTFRRLMRQIIVSTTVPFHGEPAEGLQVMGVLETRNLDFENVLILSCNEGLMPKGVNDTSFIPYAIRKSYELTTVDNKVAIYSYYFYNLIQRAKKVTIVYNNSTDGVNTGEMSRFMLQLSVESHFDIHKYILQAGQQQSHYQVNEIMKSGQVMQILKKRFADDDNPVPSRPHKLLSPSAISMYLKCPLSFYYKYVGHIDEPEDEDDGEIDNRIFGNIFHKAAELIYQPCIERGGMVTSDFIGQTEKNIRVISAAVNEAFKEELFGITDIHTPMPSLNGMQLINHEVIIQYLKQLLKQDRKLVPFRLLCLEKDVSMPVGIVVGGKKVTIHLGGRVDRIDMINSDSIIRIVDYKTGMKEPDVKTMEDIFLRSDTKKHGNYYLQAFLYSCIFRNNHSSDKPSPVAERFATDVINKPVSPALLYIQHTSKDEYNPILMLNGEYVNDIAAVADDYFSALRPLVNEIFSVDLPFRACTNSDICKNCKYSPLCGH